MSIKLSNFATTQLSSSISKTEQIIPVDDISDFPDIVGNDYFLITVIDTTGQFEIMRVTGVLYDNFDIQVAGTFTVNRGQEGTEPLAFASGSIVEHRLTADSYAAVVEENSVTKVHEGDDKDDYGAATDTLWGHVAITDNLNSSNISLAYGVSPYAINTRFKEILQATHVHIFTSSQVWIVPLSGTYNITVVGGGGDGGNAAPYYSATCAGGAGGGGGAGETIVIQQTLTKDTPISITVGGSGGTTSFGTSVTARGGGKGGNGVAHTPGGSISGIPYPCTPGSGGAAGVSYGTAATDGGAGGAAGGTGGISNEGTYGNGGNGGTKGAKGTEGMQGCVKIQLA